MAILPRFLLLLFSLLSVCALSAQTVSYSPRWFGPHASPPPRVAPTDIPEHPRFTTEGIVSLGQRQHRSATAFLDFELPLVASAASLRVYGYTFEAYDWAQDQSEKRTLHSSRQSGVAFGDLYVQTRLRLLKEQSLWPTLVLNATLKTASPATYEHYRYFDTPGYFFLLEFQKQLLRPHSAQYPSLALSGYLGFLCWETSGSLQNDAPTYQLSLLSDWRRWQCSLGLQGYHGWLEHKYGTDFGDTPLLTHLSVHYRLSPSFTLQARWEKGWHDYPYNNIGLGLTYRLPWNSARWFSR